MFKSLKGGPPRVRPLVRSRSAGTLRASSVIALSALAATAFVAVRPAAAQTYSTGTYQSIASYSGTTVGGSTFNRPNANGTSAPTALSTTATGVAYSAFTFTAPTTSSYSFISGSTSAATSFDNFTVLYGGTFNPSSPLTNAIIANDDFPTVGTSGFNSIALTGGSSYTLVTTGFSNTSAGTFSNTITREGSNPTATTIPDNNATGISTTLNVSDSFTIANFNSITLQGLSHTYVGDLVITLTHNGTTVELLDRVGAAAAGAVGSSSDLLDANSYTFALTGVTFPATPNPVPTGTYAPFANGTAGQSSTSTATLASFAGMNASGAWTVNISDRGASDVGAWRGLFSFNVTPQAGPTAAPEPGTLALLAPALSGLGGIAVVRRRKRKANG